MKIQFSSTEETAYELGAGNMNFDPDSEITMRVELQILMELSLRWLH